MEGSGDMLAIYNFNENEMLDGNNVLEFPDLDFVYADADSHTNEIAELYSYTEQAEFQQNVKAFEDQMEQYNFPPCWQKLAEKKQNGIVLKLLDQLEMSKKSLRMKAARCILYLAQGCWAEVQSDQEQQLWARKNVMMLYRCGVFGAFVELLSLEIEYVCSLLQRPNIAMRKIAVSLADSIDLRIILSVLYIITEVMRAEKETKGQEYSQLVANFVTEITNPIGDELLPVKLLGMVTQFCTGMAPHFPMKKVLLLLWKTSLVSLGGMDTLKDLKDKYRSMAGLSQNREDTLEISRAMRASSPPITAPSNDDNQNAKRSRPSRRGLIKQSSLDEQEQLGLEMEASTAENEEDITDYFRQYEDPMNGTGSTTSDETIADNAEAQDPKSSPPPVVLVEELPQEITNRLPWAPKIRRKDIDLFLNNSRSKFIGYTLKDDHETLAGLPQPIQEGFKTLKKHMYVSLADVQIRREEDITRNPLSTTEGEIQLTPTEILYQAMLPNLSQYMISLLKILLAAAPTSKAKTESINIMADVLPEDMPMTVTQSTKLGIDVSRHKEITVKAVSAILLLYLKHFKINHIYQFEFMSQHLVFANCIPLVLKFFNQDIMSYVGSKNVIPIMDFPSCVIGEQPELTSETMIIGDSAPFSWRNVFSCINLLRILNKLTKWKHSRIMMLVVFKSAPILKRTLKVRHALMQLYVLKLLKMQTKYLGRQWRKSNMKTISAIYAKVRHRLNDDWAFGNDLDARPWDFQAEECALKSGVDRFNNRRYLQVNNGILIGIEGLDYDDPIEGIGIGVGGSIGVSGGVGGDGMNGGGSTAGGGAMCTNGGAVSALGSSDRFNACYGGLARKAEEIELSEEFKQNYEMWLQQEVYNNNIDWDALLSVEELD
ncbi:striatin-interacting protein 1 homolog [Anopheles ziemanni]|uniref:striatin-interacting protein 1 homolog n=1 Tax=Anopheles ziemanni TaxID=345580 RepID=UPI002659D80A|nr:striatin-interacting protein 1 homolog isoform X3 [Anopheles coustani]XP_058177416.1 striatin-interacting protein 1 homolog [Anopheles ziemanni]